MLFSLEAAFYFSLGNFFSGIIPILILNTSHADARIDKYKIRSRLEACFSLALAFAHEKCKVEYGHNANNRASMATHCPFNLSIFSKMVNSLLNRNECLIKNIHFTP